ncbi:hypothetical protein X874_1700 [Mannheimia varigena USDA-ARS-USMARC-1312]|nr:hypothetical protein X874_1700 [Mannheimia varigena USDA-ARS-USMARC-1312]
MYEPLRFGAIKKQAVCFANFLLNQTACVLGYNAPLLLFA